MPDQRRYPAAEAAVVPRGWTRPYYGLSYRTTRDGRTLTLMVHDNGTAHLTSSPGVGTGHAFSILTDAHYPTWAEAMDAADRMI